MNIYFYVYCLRKFENNQVTTMISHVIFKNSGKLQRFLNDSTNFQKLLKAFIGMDKKILENSRLFRKLP